jgi:hypothetical protein
MATNGGKIKVVINRALLDSRILQAVMIAYLFFETAGFHWWYIPLVILFILSRIYDTRKILGQEADFIWSKSETLRGLIQDIKAIKKKLDIE